MRWPNTGSTFVKIATAAREWAAELRWASASYPYGLRRMARL